MGEKSGGSRENFGVFLTNSPINDHLQLSYDNVSLY